MRFGKNFLRKKNQAIFVLSLHLDRNAIIIIYYLFRKCTIAVSKWNLKVVIYFLFGHGISILSSNVIELLLTYPLSVWKIELHETISFMAKWLPSFAERSIFDWLRPIRSNSFSCDNIEIDHVTLYVSTSTTSDSEFKIANKLSVDSSLPTTRLQDPRQKHTWMIRTATRFETFVTFNRHMIEQLPSLSLLNTLYSICIVLLATLFGFSAWIFSSRLIASSFTYWLVTLNSWCHGMQLRYSMPAVFLRSKTSGLRWASRALTPSLNDNTLHATEPTIHHKSGWFAADGDLTPSFAHINRTASHACRAPCSLCFNTSTVHWTPKIETSVVIIECNLLICEMVTFMVCDVVSTADAMILQLNKLRTLSKIFVLNVKREMMREN